MTTAFTPDFADASDRFAAALAGQYALEREIGRGGMGIVYLARDLKLDRRVAIKTLPPHLAMDPVVRERFLREARTGARLSHPNIVPIHRADELDGHVFFVMGFVDGVSLAQRIRELGRIDPREARRVLRDVASALGYAHDHGVIHRDVKAENILLDHSGRAHVTDFGIARLAEAAPLTATGQVLGTVYYLSPEQVSGERVDARSDLYSLGVVGYFAVSGKFPFDAELASAVLIAHVTKTPPPMHTAAPDCPRLLADVIDRCLAKQPDNRFQTAHDVASTLDAIASDVDRETTAVAGAASLTGPALISDTEAQAIFGRAAELQAMTGVVPRPAPAAASRDAERDAARTSGFKPGDVRDAAVEAGIDARYVDHALEERGLAASRPTVPRPVVVLDRSKASMAAGAPTRLEYEVVVDGEMPDDDYDLIADHIRHVTGYAGHAGSVGRSFTWQSSGDRRQLHVTVLSRHGKTTIRVSEHLKRAAGGVFGGIVGGVGGGTASVWVGIAIKTHNPVLGLGLWLTAIGATYLVARGVFMITSNRRADELRALAETLGAQARESIAATVRRLPAGDGPNH